MKRALGLVLCGFITGLAGCSQPQTPAPNPSTSSGPAPIQKLTSTDAPSAVQATPVAVPVAQNPTSADERAVAHINGEAISLQQLMDALIESHGLQLVGAIAELDRAKQLAREAGITVTADDIRKERDITLGKMFKDAGKAEEEKLEAAQDKGDTATVEKLKEQIRSDREALLVQYLQQKNFSEVEFGFRIEINAYLRKHAERALVGKITDEMVEKQFGVEYGETVQVRIIQVANARDAADARRRLGAGEDFRTVAREMNVNARTAAMDGEMAAFSRQSLGIPDAFKDVAFSLQKGQVSDTLNLGGFYYIIRLDEKHPPRAVKFEHVKDAIRKSMTERAVDVTMDQFRARLEEEAKKNLVLDDPHLKRIFDKAKADFEAAKKKEALSQQMERERSLRDRILRQISPATTAPTTAPAEAAPTAPAASAPATQP